MFFDKSCNVWTTLAPIQRLTTDPDRVTCNNCRARLGLDPISNKPRKKTKSPFRTVSVDDAIAFLNELVELDRQAIGNLVETRVVCNVGLAGHPTVQTLVYNNLPKVDPADPPLYKVGFLGILNGLFGIDSEGWGPIAASFEKNEDGSVGEFIKFQRSPSREFQDE